MSEIPLWSERTQLLIGYENAELLTKSHVLIAGLGGVGGFAAEMLCRAGIGAITIVDHDVVSASNRNRQIVALSSSEGLQKADVLAARLLDINPELKLTIQKFYLKDEKIHEVLETPYDYVVDAIDTLAPKVYFLNHAMKRNLRIVSSMGAGGKLDPAQIRVSDLDESYNCKLAFYIRKKLHTLGVITGIKVVFSPEVVPRETMFITNGDFNKKTVVGTISYMPAMFGAYASSTVIRDIICK